MGPQPVGLGHIIQTFKTQKMTTAPEGFTTWCALFDYLKTNGFADQQRVALVYPTTEPETVAESISTPHVKEAAREVEIYVDEIKARAFDEIYPRLPLTETVATLTDLLDGITKMRPVVEFLNKLPKRSE